MAYVVARHLEHDRTKYAPGTEFPEDRCTSAQLRALLRSGAVAEFRQPAILPAPAPAPPVASEMALVNEGSGVEVEVVRPPRRRRA